MRRVFLWAARNRWLKEHLPRFGFMRRAVRRFMPGETMDDALTAAAPLQAAGIGTLYTRLGENLESLAEADDVVAHYLTLLERIKAAGISGEISVKPTQLGLDDDADVCLAHMVRLAEAASAMGSYLWVDMEGSAYTDATIDLYERLRATQPRTGICLQAYLRRTAVDIDRLLPLAPAIRLVKGAYDEPAAIAYRDKRAVDANYAAPGRPVPAGRARDERAPRPGHARRGARWSRSRRASARPASAVDGFEVEMLYGIRTTSSAAWRRRAIASRPSSPTASTGTRGTCAGWPSARPT